MSGAALASTGRPAGRPGWSPPPGRDGTRQDGYAMAPADIPCLVVGLFVFRGRFALAQRLGQQRLQSGVIRRQREGTAKGLGSVAIPAELCELVAQHAVRQRLLWVVDL